MSTSPVARRILAAVAIASVTALAGTGASAATTVKAVHVTDPAPVSRPVVGDVAGYQSISGVRHTVAQMSVVGSQLVAKLHEIHAVASYKCAHAHSEDVSGQLWNVVLTNLQRFTHTTSPSWNTATAYVLPKVQAFHLTQTSDACVGNNLQAIIDAGKQYFAPYMVIALLPLVDQQFLHLTWLLLDNIEAGIAAIR